MIYLFNIGRRYSQRLSWVRISRQQRLYHVCLRRRICSQMLLKRSEIKQPSRISKRETWHSGQWQVLLRLVEMILLSRENSHLRQDNLKLPAQQCFPKLTLSPVCWSLVSLKTKSSCTSQTVSSASSQMSVKIRISSCLLLAMEVTDAEIVLRTSLAVPSVISLFRASVFRDSCRWATHLLLLISERNDLEHFCWQDHERDLLVSA